MKNEYFSKSNKSLDLKLSGNVKVFMFPSYIEVTGATYSRHWKTKGELQKEIEELKTLPLSNEEYERRLSQLRKQVEQRKQVHPP